jgi:uncharacterized RDD family membrane protein YckC
MNNSEDLEIDRLLDENFFKPITKGLGFHHSLKEKKQVAVSLKEKSLDLKADLDKRARELNVKNSFENTSSLKTGELSAFYNTPQNKTVELNLDSTTSQSFSLEADLYLRLGAWTADVVIIASALSLMAISAIFISDIPLSFFRDNILSFDIGFFTLALTSLFYVFYFSFFDKTEFSTPGKRIFGLKVQGLNGNNISLVQALNRSLLSLLSLLTLGLGNILRVQDKLTDTIVISK